MIEISTFLVLHVGVSLTEPYVAQMIHAACRRSYVTPYCLRHYYPTCPRSRDLDSIIIAVVNWFDCCCFLDSSSVLASSLFQQTSPYLLYTILLDPSLLHSIAACSMAADRQATQQNLNGLLSKLDDPDPDMRYMSLNDLFGILSSANSAYLAQDQFASSKLADGLLKTLDDQHGDVQNQALKWSV